MLFQSSKLKARKSLFTETWQKRRSSFELRAFENVTPSGIGCTIDTHRFVVLFLSIITIVSLVLKDDLTGTQAGAGFVSTRKSNFQ
jgi:hypothetical protein